jgi:hypothetical protein
MFRTYHVTPAIDIWSLAVVMFTFITNKKPFGGGCKNDNLKSIVSLIGGKKILALFDKYRYKYREQSDIIDKIRANP